MSHAAIYIGNGLIAEAVLPIVEIGSVEDFFQLHNSSKLFVLRSKLFITPNLPHEELRRKVRSEALYYSHSLYSLMKAISFRLRPLLKFAATDAIICSELVARAYSRIGVNISPATAPSGVSPNDILNSIHFVKLDPPCELRSATDLTNCNERPPQWQYWIMAVIRAISPIRAAWRRAPRDWGNRHHFAHSVIESIRTMIVWHEVIKARKQLHALSLERSELHLTSQIAAWRCLEHLRILSLSLGPERSDARVFLSYHPRWQAHMRQLDRRQQAVFLWRYRVIRSTYILFGGVLMDIQQLDEAPRLARKRRIELRRLVPH